MAKPLTVVYRGETVHLDLKKVDRDKLYGYSDLEVVDDAGKPCELATLIGDGHSIVGKGGTADYATDQQRAEFRAATAPLRGWYVERYGSTWLDRVDRAVSQCEKANK